METLSFFLSLLHHKISLSSLSSVTLEMSNFFPIVFLNMSSQIPPSLLWIAAFASICVPVLALTWLLLKRLYPSLPREDKAAVCWFMVSGVFGMVFIGDMFSRFLFIYLPISFLLSLYLTNNSFPGEMILRINRMLASQPC